MVGGQDKMFQSQKYVFLNAFILALFIFGAGILLGYWFEGLRGDEVNRLYLQSELNLLDMKVVSDAFNTQFSCDNAAEENIKFGDRIYQEAKILERYENAQRISETLKYQHYKYDILRVMFFLNSKKIKENCNDSFHIVTYFYKYNEPDKDTKNKQAVFSNMLMRLKENRGSDILLIPIAGDIDFSSINLLIKEYNITQLPTILIDDKIKITEIKTAEEVGNILG